MAVETLCFPLSKPSENEASALLLAPGATYGTLLALVQHLGTSDFVSVAHKMTRVV